MQFQVSVLKSLQTWTKLVKKLHDDLNPARLVPLPEAEGTRLERVLLNLCNTLRQKAALACVANFELAAFNLAMLVTVSPPPSIPQ